MAELQWMIQEQKPERKRNQVMNQKVVLKQELGLHLKIVDKC